MVELDSATAILFNDITTNLRSLNEKVDKLSNLVGWDDCKTFRDSFDKRLTAVELVCHTYDATKPSIVDVAELMRAKEEVRRVLDKQDSEILEKLDQMNERISRIDDRTKILSLSWCVLKESKGALTIVLAGVAALFGIFYGRGLSIYEMIDAVGRKEAIFAALLMVALLVAVIAAIYISVKKGDKIKMYFH